MGWWKQKELLEEKYGRKKMTEKIDSWAEEMSYFDDDMERYQYLIDLAKKQTNLPAELCTDDNRVDGCVSQIWVSVGNTDGVVNAYYESDAMITKGITHIICDCFSGLPVEDAKGIKKEDFEKLGIEQILSGNRRNGLASLIGTLITRVGRL
jgi:cysteine desulfuration protein SufE